MSSIQIQLISRPTRQRSLARRTRDRQRFVNPTIAEMWTFGTDTLQLLYNIVVSRAYAAATHKKYLQNHRNGLKQFKSKIFQDKNILNHNVN